MSTGEDLKRPEQEVSNPSTVSHVNVSNPSTISKASAVSKTDEEDEWSDEWCMYATVIVNVIGVLTVVLVIIAVLGVSGAFFSHHRKDARKMFQKWGNQAEFHTAATKWFNGCGMKSTGGIDASNYGNCIKATRAEINYRCKCVLGDAKSCNTERKQFCAHQHWILVTDVVVKPSLGTSSHAEQTLAAFKDALLGRKTGSTSAGGAEFALWDNAELEPVEPVKPMLPPENAEGTELFGVSSFIHPSSFTHPSNWITHVKPVQK